MATRKSTTTSTTKKPASTRSTTTRARSTTAKAAASTAPKTEPTVVTDTEATVSGPELKKKELIDAVVEKSGIKKKFAKPVVEAMLDVLAEAVAEGRDMNLQPFGKFKANRSKDLSGAKVTVMKIRQSKSALEDMDANGATENENSVDSPVADAAE